eukprot:467786-Hanusia_phi.AAC.4
MRDEEIHKHDKTEVTLSQRSLDLTWQTGDEDVRKDYEGAEVRGRCMMYEWSWRCNTRDSSNGHSYTILNMSALSATTGLCYK